MASRSWGKLVRATERSKKHHGLWEQGRGALWRSPGSQQLGMSQPGCGPLS